MLEQVNIILICLFAASAANHIQPQDDLQSLVLVTRVVVVKGLPAGLTDQAIKAAYKLKFKPALRNGRPVSFWKPVLIEFHLRR